MSDEINYLSNPLNGVGLKKLLEEIISHYGFDILHAYLQINCFKTNPSLESSFKFLKKTEWAREKVEAFYLYQYKNLPRASSEQFALPPRDRIVPEDQVPGEPQVLSIEDAQRMHEKRARKAADRKSGARANSGYQGRNSKNERNTSYKSKRSSNNQSSKSSDNTNISATEDPWAHWR